MATFSNLAGKKKCVCPSNLLTLLEEDIHIHDYITRHEDTITGHMCLAAYRCPGDGASKRRC